MMGIDTVSAKPRDLRLKDLPERKGAGVSSITQDFVKFIVMPQWWQYLSNWLKSSASSLREDATIATSSAYCQTGPKSPKAELLRKECGRPFLLVVTSLAMSFTAKLKRRGTLSQPLRNVKEI